MPGQHSPNYIISNIVRKPIRNSQAMSDDSARSSIKASMGTPRFAFFFEESSMKKITIYTKMSLRDTRERKYQDTLSLGDRTMDNMDRHGGQGRPRNQMLDPPNMKLKVEPTFDYSQNTNVTALIGKTAYLTCRVRNLGDKSVSWVRHRDIHILTAGAYTYTSDQRFQALHRQNTGQNSEWSEWTLCIKWTQKRDQGLYECQISTIPVKSHQFYLNVVIPTATILGGPDLYVGAGSTINLTCAIHFSSEPPAYIFWYYNEHVLSYDSPRGGVSVITEKGGDVTTSWLLIQTAQPSDSGEYSCKPSNANTASIKVHVLNGERPEAMQTGTAGPILSSSCLLVSLIILYISSSV